MVPPAEFGSYYGRPVLKQPVWKVPDVPSYFYLGGLAGGSALMGVLADATRRPGLRRVGRYAAAGGALASVGALVHDLGRPARFLNMLRLFKPTSPLSVGSWVLAPFSGLTTAVALSEATGLLPGTARVAAAGSAVLAPAMATYTAVLISNTAIPAWHEAYPELPFLFAGGAVASAGAAGMLAAPAAQAGPARRMAAIGAGMELAASTVMDQRMGIEGEPYTTGRSGFLLKAARTFTALGGIGALFSGRSRWLNAASGAALTTGAVATRFGVFAAGVRSAQDPKYTVVPQRERLDAHEQALTR